MKLLFIITDNDKKVEKIINKFKLPFNTITHGIGTASKSMLNFFGLDESEKYISMSLIPNYMENGIFERLNEYMKLKEVGNGIAFSVPLSSSSKYINDAFMKKEGEIMEDNGLVKERKYHLLVTIVNEGFADKVMNAAKKCGANGGTLINARELGGKNSFKFFNMTMEPEKDVVLIVCKNEEKNKIMETIINKVGVKTEGQGMCFSLPIDTTLGLSDDR